MYFNCKEVQCQTLTFIGGGDIKIYNLFWIIFLVKQESLIKHFMFYR